MQEETKDKIAGQALGVVHQPDDQMKQATVNAKDGIDATKVTVFDKAHNITHRINNATK
jgi:hypothetical protein